MGEKIMGKASLLFVFLCACIYQAHAETVIVEPDDFPIGTDIRTAFPGVTLSVTETGIGPNPTQTTKPVLVLDGFDAFVNRNLATTGTSVFGQPANASLPNKTGQHWDEVTYGLLRADFASPTSFVQIDLIFGDDGIGALWAFDSSGNLLESVQAQGDGRGASSPFCPPFCDEFVTVSITRGSADIAYIIAGGVGAEGHFLDNLQFSSEAMVNTANIDIDPKRNERECNNKRQVVIFGQADFDVTTININTLEFAGVNGANGRVPNCRTRYVNEDELLDLVCKFIPGYGEATLIGELDDGTAFEGSDSICAAQ